VRALNTRSRSHVASGPAVPRSAAFTLVELPVVSGVKRAAFTLVELLAVIGDIEGHFAVGEGA
jgi:type II secretory pathway pseudopilin PulG